MNKIPGPALCGFADQFEGDDEGYDAAELVGAPKATAAPANAPKPGSKPGKPVSLKPYPKAKQSSTIATHAKVLKDARKILAKAHHSVKTAARKTLVKPAAPVSRVPAAAVSRVPTARVAVHGYDYVVLGAVAVPAAQQPKVKAAQAKLAKARANLKAATQKAATTTKAAHGSVTKLAAQVKAHERVAMKLSGKSKSIGAPTGHRTGVHGDYVGDDAAGLWPGDPGYDPTTENGTNGPAGANPWDGGGGGTSSLDAGYDTSIDPNTGAAVSPQLDVDTLVAAANAAGAVPPDQFIADFTTVPAIKYDESKGRPEGFCLSYGLATRATDISCEPNTAAIDGTAHSGYCWKAYPEKVGGIPWGEDMGHEGWNHLHGRHWFSTGGWSVPCTPEEAYASNTQTVDPTRPGMRTGGYQTSGPQSQAYGPLVGNPKTVFAGMRVDANGNMFWLANEAPDWLTYPLKAAAALTKAAADKAAKDAAAADAAAQAKAAADAAAALAAQQAQDALDEAAAASQQRQASSAAQAQADQADAQLAQQDVSSAQLDAQQQAQDLAEQQWQFQQQQQQAQQDQQQYQLFLQQQAAQQQQYQQFQDQQAQQYAQQPQYQQPQLPPQGYGDGGGGYDDAGLDDTGGDVNPEAEADAEAYTINDATLDADAEVLGRVLGPLVTEDSIVGGDGGVIGLDDYGNLTE